jgi:hypothetical protein
LIPQKHADGIHGLNLMQNGHALTSLHAFLTAQRKTRNAAMTDARDNAVNAPKAGHALLSNAPLLKALHADIFHNSVSAGLPMCFTGVQEL